MANVCPSPAFVDGEGLEGVTWEKGAQVETMSSDGRPGCGSKDSEIVCRCEFLTLEGFRCD